MCRERPGILFSGGAAGAGSSKIRHRINEFRCANGDAGHLELGRQIGTSRFYRCCCRFLVITFPTTATTATQRHGKTTGDGQTDQRSRCFQITIKHVCILLNFFRPNNGPFH